MRLLLYLLPLLLVQQPAQLPNGQFSGQIHDAKGRPVAGIRVFAMQADSADGSTAQVLTSIGLADSNGRYTLANVSPGRYLIGAGPLASPTYYPGVTIVGQGRIVTLTAEQLLANLDITFAFLPETPELYGMVGMDDGTPLPGEMLRRIQFIVSSTAKHWVTNPFTRQQGIFFFKGIDFGNFNFSIAPLPLGYYLKSATYGNVDLTRDALDFRESPDDMQIRVMLTKTRSPDTPSGVKVSGRITGWKPGMSEFALLSVANVPDATTVLNTVADVELRDDGSFEIQGVPPGKYFLSSYQSAPNSGVPNLERMFDIAGTDVGNLSVELIALPPASTAFNQKVLALLKPTLMTSIQGIVDVGDGTVPEFEIRFTSTRPDAPAAQSTKVSSKDFSVLLPQGEYRADVSGLPRGYALVSVTAGPIELSEPFLVVGAGIGDRFTGTPIIYRPARGGRATSVGITIKLRTLPANQ